MSILNSNFVERILFSIIVIGILATLVGAVKLVDIHFKLNDNLAYQFRNEDGTEAQVQNDAEARMLYASDLERRKLVKERSQMYTIAGVGLALIGFGWFGYDLRNSRRKKSAPQSATESTT